MNILVVYLVFAFLFFGIFIAFMTELRGPVAPKSDTEDRDPAWDNNFDRNQE